jgi:hypothetical protein
MMKAIRTFQSKGRVEGEHFTYLRRRVGGGANGSAGITDVERLGSASNATAGATVGAIIDTE